MYFSSVFWDYLIRFESIKYLINQRREKQYASTKMFDLSHHFPNC